MTPIVYLDLAVLLKFRTRQQRTREYVATFQPTLPDDNMTDGGGEIWLPVFTEVSTDYGGDVLGPPEPSEISVDPYG